MKNKKLLLMMVIVLIALTTLSCDLSTLGFGKSNPPTLTPAPATPVLPTRVFTPTKSSSEMIVAPTATVAKPTLAPLVETTDQKIFTANNIQLLLPKDFVLREPAALQELVDALAKIDQESADTAAQWVMVKDMMLFWGYNGQLNQSPYIFTLKLSALGQGVTISEVMPLLAPMFNERQPIRTQEIISINGNETGRIVFTTPDESHGLTPVMYMFEAGDDIYCVIFMIESSQVQAWLPRFDAIIASMRIPQ